MSERPDDLGAFEPRWTRENRIRANHALLDAIAAVWDEVPDQRFGQLVKNLSREPGGFADTWEWKHGAWYDRLKDAYRTWAKPGGAV